MKLLIVTQKVDYHDDNLGFFHDWLKQFSQHVELLTIICLQKGRYDLPSNVKVLSLGKEEGSSRIKYLKLLFLYIWKYRNSYDKVLVHMNSEYIVIAGWLWKLMGKKIYLWYTHKRVSYKLKIAEKFVEQVFTASKRSFRLPSKKLIVMGHGIDINKFQPKKEKSNEKIILTVGRFSATKQIMELVKIFQELLKYIPDFNLNIVGGPIYEQDKKYLDEVKKYLIDNNLNSKVKIVGSVSPQDILPYYQNASLFVNISKTGSLDKVVLEAMACNVPVVTNNEAFKGIVPDSSYVESLDQVASQAINILDKQIDYRSIIVNNHSLSGLINRLIKNINAK